MHKRRHYNRKVKFNERGKKLAPIPDSPVPPPIDKLVLSSAVTNSTHEESTESFHKEAKRVSLMSEDRNFSAGFSDIQSSGISRDSRQRSLSLKKENKLSFPLTSNKRAASIPAGGTYSSLSGKRSSISTLNQGGGGMRLSLANEESFSEAFSFSHESIDDLVDNLTKQKLNMQLKGVTDRISEVLDEYEKHTEENPKHRLFGSIGGKLDEMDDMKLKNNILMLITNYKDACTEREKILYSLSQWFSAEHMKNFTKVINDRRLSGTETMNLFDTYPVCKSVSQDSKRESDAEQTLEVMDADVVSSTVQRIKQEADDVQSSYSHDSRSMSQLSVIMKKVSEKTGKSVHDIEAAWSSASANMCELLQWARSEGVADLFTINNFLETLADHTELFNTVKEELQQQKQLSVMSDMTILRLSDQNTLLQKDVDKHEDQMTEARRMIKQLQKQLKEGYQPPLRHQATQTASEEEHSKEFLELLVANGDIKILELNEKLTTAEMENVQLKQSLENLQKEHETAADLYDKEILLYKEEVDRLMETIMREEEEEDSSTDLSKPNITTTDSMPENILSIAKIPTRTQSLSTPTLPMPSHAGELLSITKIPEPGRGYSHSSPQLPTFVVDGQGLGPANQGSRVGTEPGQVSLVVEPADASDLTPQAFSLMPPREQKVVSPASTPGRSSDQLDIASQLSDWSEGSGVVQGIRLLSEGGKGVSKQELKSKRKLQASLVDNAKVKFELLQKERLLKIAEQEVDDLKRKLGEAVRKSGLFRDKLSSTPDTLRVGGRKSGHQIGPSLASIKRILQPGKKLPEATIDKILTANNDKINVKLVQELVTQLNVGRADIHDIKAKNEMICDLHNVCNIVVHLQNKMAPSESLPDKESAATKDDELRADQTQADVQIKLTGSSDVDLAKPADDSKTAPGEDQLIPAKDGAKGAKEKEAGHVSPAKDGAKGAKEKETGHVSPAKDGAKGAKEKETGHVQFVQGRRISLIQKVVDLAKSGSQELLKHANSEFLCEVESELQAVCNTLSAIFKKSQKEEDDAEQLLLSSTLAVPNKTHGDAKPTNRRRRSYTEGISPSPMDFKNLKKDAKDKSKMMMERKRRISMPEHMLYSSKRVTPEVHEDVTVEKVKAPPRPKPAPAKPQPKTYLLRKDLAQFRELFSRRSGQQSKSPSPRSSTSSAVYHLQEDRERQEEDDSYAYQHLDAVPDDGVLKGNRLPIQGDIYNREQHRKRALELYTNAQRQSRSGGGLTDIITGSGLSLSRYNRELHRKRSLEMYSNKLSRPSSAGPDQEESVTIPHTYASPGPSRSDSEATGSMQFGEYVAMRASRQMDQFPLIMEKYMLPTLVAPAEFEAKQKTFEDRPTVRHTISVSGNYISPPPEALGFARRTGKFRTSTSSPFNEHSNAMPPGWKDVAALFDPGPDSRPASRSGFSSIASRVRANSRPGSIVASHRPMSPSIPNSRPGSRSGSYSRPGSRSGFNSRPGSRSGYNNSRPGSKSGPSTIPDSRPGPRASGTVPELRIIRVGSSTEPPNF